MIAVELAPGGPGAGKGSRRQADRIGDVGDHWRHAEREQGRKGDQRPRADNGVDQARKPPGAEERQEVEPGHCVRFGWLSWSDWPFGIAGAEGGSGVIKPVGSSGRTGRSSSWAS